MSDAFDIDELLETPDESPDASRGDDFRPSYAWALDCDWVWRNLGGKMTREKAGTAARWALWQNAKKDMDKFIALMAKAMPLLDKALDKEGDADIVAVKEKKQIKELKQILADALVEAGRT
jgi:hypothetical protein